MAAAGVLLAGVHLAGGLLAGVFKNVKDFAAVMCKGMQAVEAIKAMSKDQMEALKFEVQQLKAQLQIDHVKVIEELKWIGDRTDKCSNKLEVMEYRVEGLVYQPKDTRRHLCQCITEFRMK